MGALDTREVEAARTRARRTTLAVGYARRSTDRQEQSIADQRRAVEAYAAQHDCAILDWYVDDAISGAGADEREAFLKMVEDAQRPDCPFEAILVYDVKRFGRLDNDETGHYRYLLRRAGVDVIYVSENFNGDDTDDLLRPVKQWQARQELKDLSKVTIRGLLSKADGGWWMRGVPPYGYDLAYYDANGEFLMIVRYVTRSIKEIYDEDGNLQRRLGKGDHPMVSKGDRARLVPGAPERVEVLKRIFRMYVHEGLGYKGVCDRLNSEGVPSPRGGTWSMTTARDMIRNPAYVGDMVWNRRSMAKFHKIENGRATPTPRIRKRVVEENGKEDWLVTEDAHPALIDRQTFERAETLRKKRRKHYEHNYRRGRGATSDYLLTGLIVCANCGHNWQGYTVRKGRRRKDGSQVKTKYYACGGYVSKGNSVCRRSVVRKDEIEEQVFEAIGRQVAAYVGTPDGRARLLQALEQELASIGERDAAELSRLTAERDDILRKINGILDNITETNREFADQRIAQLKEGLEHIEPRIVELEASAEPGLGLADIADELLAHMESFPEVVAEGTVDEKRRFIRAFVQRIEIDPQTQQSRLLLRDLPASGA